MYFRIPTTPGGDFNSFNWYAGGSHTDDEADAYDRYPTSPSLNPYLGPGPGGQTLMSLFGVNDPAIGNLIGQLEVHGDINSNDLYLNSDRNLKENFTAVDSLGVLEKVAAMPITKWNFKNNHAANHVGPMAQDFRAAFGLGKDGTHIASTDEGGVALAAIQGLNQKVEEKNQELDARNQELEERLSTKDAEIEQLKEKAAQVDALEERLKELERTVRALAAKK